MSSVSTHYFYTHAYECPFRIFALCPLRFEGIQGLGVQLDGEADMDKGVLYAYMNKS